MTKAIGEGSQLDDYRIHGAIMQETGAGKRIIGHFWN